jgi:hypothetical protein
MSRRALIVFSLVALFGLRAPLCLLACLEIGASGAVVASAPAEPGPPCHGNDPATSEEEPVDGHECGCDEFQLVLTKLDSSKSGGLEAEAPTPLRVAFLVPPFEIPTAPLRSRQALPPPDILLLKSTLLL